MRLKRARVQNYRSIVDSDWFEIEEKKTILVGPNEAGKTVLLQALQHINPPSDIKPLDDLRDYPRANYKKISTGVVDIADVPIVHAEFTLDADDMAAIDAESPIESERYAEASYTCSRYLDGEYYDWLENGPDATAFKGVERDLKRLASHADKAYASATGGTADDEQRPSTRLSAITAGWKSRYELEREDSKALAVWLDSVLEFVDEGNDPEQQRWSRLQEQMEYIEDQAQVLELLKQRVPIFVLFNNYFRVRPVIHLGQLAARINDKRLDDSRYDYGNVCLMKLLGFDAQKLSQMGTAADPDADDPEAIEGYRQALDRRQYMLNAAEVQLTQEIQSIWETKRRGGRDTKIRIRADGQYFKVSVEDELGVEVELDQRSEGFQWLVSFFVVFFAEAQGKHENAILLLDEPGLSLHGLKQREFRNTVSRLAANNQTLYTTHSPFLVGPDELDLVRVVEMKKRKTGTKIHNCVTATDPAAFLPLQEALGYDLAQSLFTQKKNLVLEGLTDYWYVEAASGLLREGGIASLDPKTALVPASSAGKVVYFATLLHSQSFKVAALLDSDNAGDQAAQQDTLVHTLGNRRILRTGDFLNEPIRGAEIEDIFRETLVRVAKQYLDWDIKMIAETRATQPIAKVFKDNVPDFSKYKLAKAFLRWTRESTSSDLSSSEREQAQKLIDGANRALK